MSNLGDVVAAAGGLIQPFLPVLGVLLGAGITMLAQRAQTRRAHRRELTLSALEAVTNARSLVAQQRMSSIDTGTAAEPLYASESATAIWARFEMLAAFERAGKDQRALAANGMATHEWLMGGAQSSKDFQELGAELRRLSLLLVAWERGRARGRDFALAWSDAFIRFGPDYTENDLPPTS